MSTNYYFVSKEDLRNEKRFNKFIEKLNIAIEKKWNGFLNTVDDGRFEDIFYDFQKDMQNKLEIAYEPEKIHICKTNGGNIKFQSSDCFGNMEELEQFYNENKSNYVIQDEYGENFTFKSFLNQIGYNATSEYIWVNYYFS